MLRNSKYFQTTFPLWPTMTLRDAIDLYVRHLREELHRTPQTIRTYELELRYLARRLEAEGLTDLAQLSRPLLLEHLNAPRNGREPAPATRNRKLTVLRGFFGYLVAAGEMAADPTAGLRWSRPQRNERPTPTQGDVRRLLAVLGREPESWLRTRDVAIVVVLFHTGLRLAELVSLDLHQVELNAGLLLGVRRKGGHQQPIPLNETAVAVLRGWREVRPEVAGLDALFISRFRRRLSARAVQARLQVLCDRAGIAYAISPHRLRHGFATELLRTGANLEEVKRLMGHSDIKTTSRYSHPDAASLRRAVERLGGKGR